MNKEMIKQLALDNGFKLKEQPSGEMDLNPYVFDYAAALISPLEEGIAELQETNRSLLAEKAELNEQLLSLKKEKETE